MNALLILFCGRWQDPDKYDYEVTGIENTPTEVAEKYWSCIYVYLEQLRDTCATDVDGVRRVGGYITIEGIDLGAHDNAWMSYGFTHPS